MVPSTVASREESMWVEHIQDGQEKEGRQEEGPEKTAEKKSGFTLPSYGEALWLCYLRNRDDNEEEDDDEEREYTTGLNAAPKEGYADNESSTHQCSPKRLLAENNTLIHGPPRAKRSRRNSVVAWRRWHLCVTIHRL